jgi:hypothetical protein
MKKLLLLLSCVVLFSAPNYASAASTNSTEVLTLDWIDLIPENERHAFDQRGMPVQLNHEEDAPEQSKIGSVRQELNDSMVKIPGFVIPLEGDNNVVTEFILVPFLGACVHVPPPPPNQIIYVRFPQGAPVQELWDVVYVVGKLKTETVSHELAEVGYVIDGSSLEAYED